MCLRQACKHGMWRVQNTSRIQTFTSWTMVCVCSILQAVCLVGGTGGIAPGPWSECSTYYTTVLLWSVLNVLLILLIGRCLARHKIMVKL